MPSPDAMERACRAMRLPFLGASVLPFAAGVSQAGVTRGWGAVLLGLLAVAATHLAANMINELADAASGADAQDPARYTHFGGSKQLQRGELSPRWYRRAVAVMLTIAALALIVLAARLQSCRPLWWGVAAAALAWAYSAPPWRLMSRGAGEAAVGLLFGPATVLAGWFCGTSRPAGLRVWLLACALGLLTAGVLSANEVPDAADDARVGKRHMVVRLGASHGWRLYALICLAAAVALGAAAWLRPHWSVSLAVALPVTLGLWVTLRLRRHAGDKAALTASSHGAVALQALTAVLTMVDGWRGPGT
ncbi:MAG: prenyltransferase [Kiritimatiellae bacterium]|nr:prenyltransferase [Kiritimatiellia bacterium]